MPKAIDVQVIRGPHVTTPHSKLEYVATESRVFEFAEGACAAFDLNSAEMIWSGPTPVPPVWKNLPRKLDTGLLYTPRVLRELNLVVHLCPADEGGLWVLARRLDTGTTPWETRIELPSPQRWTERESVPQSETEVLRANIANLTGRIVIAVQRTSRRSAVWTADHHYPMPPWDGGLHLFDVDPATGRIVHEELIDRGTLGFSEQERFDGTLSINSALVEYDWSARRMRRSLEVPSQPRAFIRNGSVLIVAYVDGRVPCLAGLDTSFGRALDEVRLPRNSSAVKIMDLRSMENGALLVINDTRLALVDAELGVRFETRVKPYVYAAALTDADVLFIGTDGKGTNFYAFDARTGETLRHEPKPGSPFFARCANQWVAAYDRTEIACVSADGRQWRRHQTTQPIGVRGVAGSRVWGTPTSDQTGIRLGIDIAEIPAS